MPIVSPLSPACVTLAFMLPGIVLAGRAVARWLVGERSALALSPAISLALWLLPVHFLALARESFSFGLVVGTVSVGMIGFLYTVVKFKTRSARFSSHRSVTRRGLWLAALATALIVPMTIGWCLHDEVIFLGHMSIPAQMHNDVYPPRYLGLPQVSLRYHYGFDLFVAVVAAISRLRIDHAIDLVTLACFFYGFWLLSILGDKLYGSRGALCAIVVLFGAGLPVLCPPIPNVTVGTAIGICTIEHLYLNPPMISYFYQHPWSLGLPVAFATILLAIDREMIETRRHIVLCLLLVLLSFSQVVLFMAVSGSLLARAVLGGGHFRARPSFRQVFMMLFTLGVSFGGAMAVGGFFTKSSGGNGLQIVFKPGVVDTAWGTVQWLALTYGALLPLGLAGFLWIRRERVLLGTLFVGSLMVIMLFRYAYTWDMVKFGTVAALSLSVFSGAAIARLAANPRFSWLLAGPALLVTTALGFAHPIVYGLDMPEIPPLWTKEPPKVDETDARAIMWLRTHLAPGEIAYRRSTAAFPYAVWGGIPQVWLNSERVFGVDSKLINARLSLLNRLPSDSREYAAQGIRFFVLDNHDTRIMQIANKWRNDGHARVAVKFDDLEIIELLKK